MLPYQNLSLEDMPGEVWKDIPGWDGYYQASNTGRIKAISRIVPTVYGATRTIKEHIMRQYLSQSGYPSLHLSKDKFVKGITAHILVCSAFHGLPEPGQEVDHINAVRHDNRAENLRWVCRSENARNPHAVAIKKELYRRYSHPVICTDSSGNETYYKSLHCAEADGFYRNAIVRCAKGTQKIHHGCTFRYAD